MILPVFLTSKIGKIEWTMKFKAGQSETFLERKHLSKNALIKTLKGLFGNVTDKRSSRNKIIKLADALMAAFAMFSLKMPSMLSLDELRHYPERASNLRSLFLIDGIPSDTSMRDILDIVDPKELSLGFTKIFAELQRGKALEPYTYLEDAYLIAIDGTGYFSSDSISCECCLEKKHKNGTTTFHHQMLAAVLIHPDQKVVIPLFPEPIVKQDGNQKNDCERNACKRMLDKIRADHDHLKIIITEDGLASNAPHIRDLKAHKMSYILGAKPGDHKHLFEEFQLAGSREQQVLTRDKDGTVHIFRWVNGLPLNEKNKDIQVNFLDYEECRPNGKSTHFTWVTDIEITEANAKDIMRGGRARWKIENETFNTLKNQGYQFEHNYGHGYKNLSTVLASLMMLAFLVDQAVLLTCKFVQDALAKTKRMKELFYEIRSLFDRFHFTNWSELYSAIAYGMQSSFTLNVPIKNST